MLDRATLGRLLFLELAAGQDAAWADALNRRVWINGGLKARLGALLKVSDVQAVLTLPTLDAGGNMALLRLSDAGEVVTLATAPRPPSGNKAFALALRRMLGYDGVVLAQEGRYLLSLAPDLAKAGELFYGVALGNSAHADFVAQDQQVAVALLRLVRSNGHYAVWRLTSTVIEGDVPVGTKLVLETQQRRSLRSPGGETRSQGKSSE